MSENGLINFHTTSDDEAATAAAGIPVTLSQSHGCIHLKPKDIDDMIAKGYFKGGNKVVVHAYSEKIPSWVDDATASAPFELHFFRMPEKSS